MQTKKSHSQRENVAKTMQQERNGKSENQQTTNIEVGFGSIRRKKKRGREGREIRQNNSIRALFQSLLVATLN